MNEIELFLTKLYDFCVRNKRVVTKDELYSYINKVEKFNSYDQTLFYDVCDYPEIYLQNYEENRLLSGLNNNLYYYFSMDKNYKRIEVGYDDTYKTGIRDNIKLYIPLQGDNLVKGSKKIFEFLFKQSIPFVAKISKTKRLDGFIIRLFNKEDALNLLEECKSIDNLLSLNPFIPTVNKIGVARDTYQMSYQYHLCKILSDYSFICMNNISDEIFTIDHFKKYLKKITTTNLTNKENFMNSVVINGINCVLNNTNILDTFIDKYEIEYRILNYEYDKNTKSYVYDGLYITIDNNLKLFIELQVNRFLNLLCKFKNKEIKEFKLNEKITSYVAYIIDRYNDANENIKLIYKIDNKEIVDLIPYLYAYFAIKKRNFDSYKALDIIQSFK